SRPGYTCCVDASASRSYAPGPGRSRVSAALGPSPFSATAPTASSTLSLHDALPIPTILRLSHVRSFGELPYCEGLPATWPRHRDALIARLDVQGLLDALGLRKLA